MSKQHVFLTMKQQEEPTITDAEFRDGYFEIYQSYEKYINHYMHFTNKTFIGHRASKRAKSFIDNGNVIAIFRLKYLKPLK